MGVIKRVSKLLLNKYYNQYYFINLHMDRYHQHNHAISRQLGYHQEIAHSGIDASVSIQFQYAATFQQPINSYQVNNRARRMIAYQDSLQLSDTLLIQSSLQAVAYGCINVQQNGLVTPSQQNNELADSDVIFDHSRLNKKQRQEMHYQEVQNQLDELCPWSSESLHMDQQSLQNETKLKFQEEFESRMEQIRLKFHQVEQKVFNSKKLNSRLAQNESKEKMFCQFCFDDPESNKENICTIENEKDSMMSFGITNPVYQNLQIRGLKNKDEELIVSILLKLGYLKEEQILFGVDHNESNRLTNLIKQARYCYCQQSFQKYKAIGGNGQPNSIQNCSGIQQLQEDQNRNQEQSDVSMTIDKFNQNTHEDPRGKQNPIQLDQSQQSVSILQDSRIASVSPFECQGNAITFPYQPKIIIRVDQIKKQIDKIPNECEGFCIRVQNSDVLNSRCFNTNQGFDSVVVQGQLNTSDEECFYNMHSEQPVQEEPPQNLIQILGSKSKSEFVIEPQAVSQNENGEQNGLGSDSQGSVFRAFYIPEGDQKLKHRPYGLSKESVWMKKQSQNDILVKGKDQKFISYLNMLRSSNFVTNACQRQESSRKQSNKVYEKLRKFLQPFPVKSMKKCYGVKSAAKLGEKENCRFHVPLFIVSKNKLRKNVKVW